MDSILPLPVNYLKTCGNATLITIKEKNQTKNINILIDGGHNCTTKEDFYDPKYKFQNVFPSIAKKKLRKENGKYVIDYVIITHMHSDHLTGLMQLNNQNSQNPEYQVNKLYLTRPHVTTDITYTSGMYSLLNPRLIRGGKFENTKSIFNGTEIHYIDKVDVTGIQTILNLSSGNKK